MAFIKTGDFCPIKVVEINETFDDKKAKEALLEAKKEIDKDKKLSNLDKD